MRHSSRRNPLALMVLCTLWEQPTHPYQLVQILKGRQKDKAARLNYGSLYTVIATLEKAGLIEAVEVTKVGNLPPRTTYRVTDDGASELTEWLSDLVAEPAQEIPQFMTALSILPALPVERAEALLRRRVEKLQHKLEEMGAERAATHDVIPELFSIEARYLEAMTQAELAFTEKLIDDISSGRLSGVSVWQAMQRNLKDGRPDQSLVKEIFEQEGFLQVPFL